MVGEAAIVEIAERAQISECEDLGTLIVII
jgi:hypothetical protein